MIGAHGHFERMSTVWKNEKGVVFGEFAIAFPLFIGLVAAIIDFGQLFWVRHELNLISQTIAHRAALMDDLGTASKASLVTEINQQLSEVGGANIQSVVITGPADIAGDGVQDTMIGVSIDAEYTLRFFGIFGVQPVEIDTEIYVRYELQSEVIS